MKNYNYQSGVGFLPIMIVVLLVAMSGIGYTVYKSQEKLNQQAAQQDDKNQANNINAPLPEVQQQLSDKLVTLLSTDNEAATEQVESSFIIKDEASNLLIQMSDDNLATRITLTVQPTQSSSIQALQTTKNTLESFGFTHFSGTTQDSDISGLSSVSTAYNRGDDYCYVSNLLTSYVEVGCVSASRPDIQRLVSELKPYYEAAKKDYEAQYPDETYPQNESVITINETTRKTIDNTYETISGGAGGVGEVSGFYEVLGGGRYHFYRKIGGEWQVSPSSGNGISSCSEFNTDTLRLLYADQSCWSQETESDTTVAEYWQ